MFILSTWLLFSHFYLNKHLVVDELIMDGLILFDVVYRANKVGMQTFIRDIKNWPALLCIWLSIMYWITYSVLPVMDIIDTVFNIAQSIMALYRVTYACCRSYFVCVTYKYYEPVVQDLQYCTDDFETSSHPPRRENGFKTDCEDVELIVRFSPTHTTISPKPPHTTISPTLSVVRPPLADESKTVSNIQLLRRFLADIYINKNVEKCPLFSTDLHGFSMVTIASKLSGIDNICWCVHCEQNDIVLYMDNYKFKQKMVQHPSFAYTAVIPINGGTCDESVISHLALNRVFDPVASSTVGRFEIHGRSIVFVLSDELQSIYFSHPLVKIEGDILSIDIYRI